MSHSSAGRPLPIRGTCSETPRTRSRAGSSASCCSSPCSASATALFLTQPGAPQHLRAAGRHGSCSTRPSCSRPRSSRSSPASASRSKGGVLDLLLAAGFFVAGVGTLAFSVVPSLGGSDQDAPEAWAAIGCARARGDADRARAARSRAADRRAEARAPASGSASWSERSSPIWLPLRGFGARLSLLDSSGDGVRAVELTVATSFLALLALARRARLRHPLPRARRGPRQLARARRDADAVRRAALRPDATRLERLHLPGRLPPPARLRRAARRRLARDQLRRVRARGRGGARARGAGDPRRPRAVPLRRLDAREHARGRRAARADAAEAEAGRRGRAAGGALRRARAVLGERHRALRRGAAPLRRVPHRRRRARGRRRDRSARSCSRPTSRSRSSGSSRRGSRTSASTRARSAPRSGSASGSAGGS